LNGMSLYWPGARSIDNTGHAERSKGYAIGLLLQL